jgi:superfamily II DNA helicase RecQ
MVKDGETITFRRVASIDGASGDVSDVLLRAVPEEEAPRGRRARRPRKARSGKAKAPRAKRAKGADAAKAALPDDPLVQALRAYLAAEAKRLGVPAFRIFTDRTLAALVEARPTSGDALAAVPGVGPAFGKRHGAAVIALVRGR